MARLISALSAFVLAFLLLTHPAGAQTGPGFRLGFATLAALIPEIVGEPIEDEHYGANGDSLQQTTTGLMVWRKADNWTAFTDGVTTWINGPEGLQTRLNEERFPWEQEPVRSSPAVPSVGAPSAPPTALPRVNVYPTAGGGRPDWSRAAIFWFGRATEQENYADVRVGYNDEALYLFATVVDYHLWFNESGGSDPREYDALALFLSTGSEQNSPIGAQDYLFVSGFRGRPVENDPRWHRQARGGGSQWDQSWQGEPAWTDLIGLRYYRSGPNNDSDRDAGWATTIRVPWATLGLAGPPPSGTRWRLGIRLYDRDEPLPGRMVEEKSWPASLVDSTPSTWGVLDFGEEPAAKPVAPVQGSTVIRRGSSGARVLDSYVGGGGNCQGGVFGGGDKPHAGSESLFVQNQSDVADFPCFSKSYLRFDLSDVPPGKTILAATLRLHSFGGSDPTQAKPSYIQLFTVNGEWDEATLTWNNAPTARENVGMSRVDVLPSFPGWPGVPSEWDATRAVAEAYASGKLVDLALYSADTAYHSGKYFVSSDTGDWNAVARPTLTVLWGERPN